MGSDEEGKALATPEFWNTRYDKSDGSTPTHEWFRSFQSLKPFFDKHLPTSKSIRMLHLGSGDSTVPTDLAALGYRNQLCVDFSEVVVEMMKDRGGEGVEWKWADVRDMREQVESGSVDVAFDKGTMDAMIHGSPWSPPDDVLENTGRYVKEVHRVLKDEGVFLYVTYRQPHFIKPLLNRSDLWNLEMEVLSEGDSSFDYYGWVLRKKAS